MPGGLHPPIAVILSWGSKVSYVDPPTRGWSIVILCTVLLTCTYIVVGMRLWARFVVAKSGGIDDALIIFNMVPLTGLAVALILAFQRYGFNHHVWDNTDETLVKSRKITVALEALYMVSTATTKISILLFYRRLAEGSISVRFLYTVYAAIAFVVVYFIVFWINLFTGCRPFYAFWMQVDLVWAANNAGKYHCFDELKNLIIAAGFSVAQDFIACGLPMILFWKLKVPRRQKIALGAIFGVGFFLCICGVLRITETIPIYTTTYDMTWGSYRGWIWFAIEAHLAVICASAPALKIFFKHTLKVSSIINTLRGKTFGTNGNTIDSRDTGSTALNRYKEKRGMQLNNITVDTEISTSYGGKDKPFTIFSSQERLSGSYQESQYVENNHAYEMHGMENRRLPDEERGVNAAARGQTFFNDGDSD